MTKFLAPIEGNGNGDVELKLGDAAGADEMRVLDSADVEVFAINSDGKITTLTATEEAGVTGDKVLYIDGGTSEVRSVDWSNLPGAGGGISNVVEDTTPELGGDLDVLTRQIVSSTTNDIDLHSANTIILELGDAAGAEKVSIRDSAAVEVASIDSDGNIAGNNLSGTNTGDEVAATDSTAGVVELATIAETDTGTDATRAVTPDGLAGSIHGEKSWSMALFESDVDVAVGDGKIGFCVPLGMDTMDIVDCVAAAHTAGTTGTMDIQIRRRRDTTDVDVLSTKLTIDSTETRSTTAAAAHVINTANDDLNEGDLIYVDVDAVQTTAAKGLTVTITARVP